MVLEMTEFKWTIEDVLQQPEQELDAVMYLKAMGEKPHGLFCFQRKETV